MKIKTNLGYGTAYEKVLLFYCAENWVKRYDIKNVLEYPTNNLMGNNNEIFERLLGKENCVKADINKKFFTNKYDMVWCFCEFENASDSQKFLQNMFDKSKFTLIITQNYFNLGLIIHRFWHFLLRRKWDHGIIRKSSSRSVKKYIEGNYEIVESGAFDCPWFYFDIYETFSDIKRLFKKDEQNEKEFIIKQSLFEKLPYSIKFIICHHNYLIIKNNNYFQNF